MSLILLFFRKILPLDSTSLKVSLTFKKYIEFALKDDTSKHFVLQKELFSRYKISLMPIEGS